jgi:hypothetical protein
MDRIRSLNRLGLVVLLFLSLCLGESVALGGPLDSSLVTEKYAYLDPGHLVPAGLLNAAVEYYVEHLSEIGNKTCLTIVDFSLPSNAARFFVVNMSSGRVRAFRVAHGKGSDPGDQGTATRFGNTPVSHESSLGVYLTAETYSGGHGYSLRLDGLSKSNSNARAREIVVHGASYVVDEDVKPGRSWGCFALSLKNHQAVIEAIKGGSLIFVGRSGRST